MPPIYITTPIYYVNDRPHIGHCYTTVVADAYARFQRLITGDPSGVFLLTGTDEHADKVVTSAAQHNATPQSWADQNAEQFREAFRFMGISNDDFIRTTEPRHKERVPVYIKRLIDSGDIYKGEYTGWYDTGQEEYVTETAARENNYHSPINKKPLVKRTEPCYFFRLGKYQQALLDLIARDESFVQPAARRQEVLGRLKPPAVLNDVPVSRPVTDDPATQWGIRIPGDPAHRVYVWIDALFNYLTVVDTPDRRKWWPPVVHFLGKDILWFHAVIWPALLMALGEKLPGSIFGHGWWISEGEKMSKSLGNFIDLPKMRAYAERYSLDALRWYLLTQGPLSGSDADFSHAKFIEVYNADLANGIGNCASRVGNMVEKYFGGSLPAPGATHAAGESGAFDFGAICRQAHDATTRGLAEKYDIAGALLRGVEIIRQVDGYINVTAPFKLAKTVDSEPGAKDRLGTILYTCAEAIRVASLFISPACPGKMGSLWSSWGCVPPPGSKFEELAAFGGKHALRAGQRVGKGEVMFMRADAGDKVPG